ncbi:MAG: SDR family NAD(P)-dependent oxidoreductase [Desulfatibacillum sp.]|nr:SDR family NAD(P)-dependent oxidoreductase [Desulfatibacillum sp.]
MIGITSYGAYIPRLRLDRMAIVQSMGWFAPAIMVVAQGERSMCNWDEDALTMAVSASQDCLKGMDKNKLDAVYLASTTLPFADRQNAGVIKEALNLQDDLLATDVTGSQKAGTTALITALDAVAGGNKKNILVTATDKRETKGAYFYEMWFGDGAASVAVGNGDNVIAEFLGSYSASHDFNDHYRGANNRFDYVWEERWARDMGYSQFLPKAIKGAMEKAGVAIGDVSKLVYPCFFGAEHKKIAKTLGATPEQVVSNFHKECGECGVAHPFVMLASALDNAKAGDIIVVAGYGHGVDALVFKVTDKIAELAPRDGFAGTIGNKKIVDNYSKYLVFRGLVENEMGIRAEAETQTAMTVLWRKRKMLLGLVGGKCRECGTKQFPKMDICVNPSCGAHHSQDEQEFIDTPATIKTFTADMLSVSFEPPNKYGLIQFEGGGRMMADFTDCDQDELRVGLPMKMIFRLRSWDKDRGFKNYFWKAAPVPGAAAEMDKINFKDRVAVITGAGGGLGRTYALELAARGCKVVVNDLGGSRDGSGTGDASPADNVVNEIKEMGGEAVANYDNVATPEGGAGIIQSAIDAFGRIDIVINNAGILRDKSFLKMEPDNWNAVLAVHLHGAYNVTKPAFTLMKQQGFGRIIMTTSAAGLYGNFGQTNYSSAKMALVGFMNTLKLEGAKYNIKVNTVAPLAASRLTEDIMPPEIFAKMKPEFVSPMVLYLCSEECKESGQIFNAGMGYFNRAAVFTGPAVQLGEGDTPPSLEDIADNWDAINSMEGAKELSDLNTAMFDMLSPPAAPAAEAAPAAGGAIKPADIFAGMGDSFNADKADGVDVVFQFSISGGNGGEWNVTVKDKACAVADGKAAKATCTIIMEDADFVAMITGQLNPMTAFNSGKLKIEGDIMKSQLIDKLFTVK